MTITIQDILDTLNMIEVHGKSNMDKMLGVIMALEMLQKQIAEQNSNQTEAEEGSEE